MSEPAGLHVVRHKGEGIQVVLVHGAMDRHNSFRRTARRIPGRRLVLYDRRGYGKSRSADETCDFTRHVADLMDLIGDEPAVVVGHSMGALIALHAAAVYPGRILAVGAFEPPLPWLPWWPVDWIPDSEEPPEVTVQKFHERIIGPGTWHRIPASLRDQYTTEAVALRTDLAVGRDGPLFETIDVAVPVVVGHGSRSTEHHIRAVEILADQLPDAELIVIDGAQHGAHRSHADAFADFARAVIGRVPTRGGPLGLE